MTQISLIDKGRYRARLADGAADLDRAQALRSRVFRAQPDAGDTTDADSFDALCQHVLIEDSRSDTLVGCFRLLPMADGTALAQSYAAQFYDLSRLARQPGPLTEVGRFCIAPEVLNADVLRVAWGALTRHVDEGGVRMLVGCSTFAGTDPARYSDAFSLLRARHSAPAALRPGIKAPEVVDFTDLAESPADVSRALRALPPLLRSYLSMGGWVSDHAVIDRDLGTLHVFTALDVGAVPPARRARLRAVAAP